MGRLSFDEVTRHWAAVYRSLFEREEERPTLEELAWAIVLSRQRVRFDAALKIADLAIQFAMTREGNRWRLKARSTTCVRAAAR